MNRFNLIRVMTNSFEPVEFNFKYIYLTVSLQNSFFGSQSTKHASCSNMKIKNSKPCLLHSFHCPPKCVRSLIRCITFRRTRVNHLRTCLIILSCMLSPHSLIFLGHKTFLPLKQFYYPSDSSPRNYTHHYIGYYVIICWLIPFP